MSKIVDGKLKQEIIEYFLSQPMTLKQVENKYRLSHPTVSKILKNIPKYTRAKLNNPNLKEHYFQEIDEEAKAYFLGLLIADGNIFKKENSGRQASISITLKLGDKYILDIFKGEVNSSTSIGCDGRGCGQIAIRSDIMAKDLAQYGVVPRKSFKTYLPVLNNEMMRHLIRGILDGDGSVLAKLNKDNRFLHSISFCGTYELMQNISDYIFKTLSLKQKPTVYDYKNKRLSELKIQNRNDMCIFGEWLYKDTNIFLIRKRNVYNSFKKRYNLN